MVVHSAVEAQTIFGIEPTWLAASLFLITYGLIMLERVNRAIIAGFAAGLMVLSGVLTQEAAVRGIDFNTIGLLTGMMIIVAITRKSGIFQYMAIWSAKKVKADPWGILVMLVLVTAVFFSPAGQRHHRIAHRSCYPVDHRRTQTQSLPVFVLGDLRLQYRWHRHLDR